MALYGRPQGPHPAHVSIQPLFIRLTADVRHPPYRLRTTDEIIIALFQRVQGAALVAVRQAPLYMSRTATRAAPCTRRYPRVVCVFDVVLRTAPNPT